MLKEHTKKLVDLGLSEKEANVYLTLLNEGSEPIDTIGNHTGLNRSTTYVQLTNLTRLGLVSSHKKGKKIFFTAESPNNLERLLDKYALQLEQRRAEAGTFLPELMKMFGNTGIRPTVRMFEGKEGLTAMRNDILDQKPKNMYVTSSIDDMRRVFNKKELLDFTLKREKAGIRSRVIYSLEEGDDFSPRKMQTFKRVNKDSLPFGSDIYIYDDNVSFASVGDYIVGMTITNHGIAQTMYAMFNSLWKSL